MEIGVSSIPVSEVFVSIFIYLHVLNLSISSIAKNMLTLVRPTQGSHSAKMSILSERQQQDLRSLRPIYRLDELS